MVGGSILLPVASQSTVAACLSKSEGREVDVGAADEDADALISLRPIDAACDGGEGRRAAGLGDNRNVGPKAALGLRDRRVRNQDHLANEVPSDFKIELAHPLRAE